jgi:hypothetical protein
MCHAVCSLPPLTLLCSRDGSAAGRAQAPRRTGKLVLVD